MGISQSTAAPPTNAPIARRVSSFRVVHYDPGTIISIDGPSNPFLLFGNQTFHAIDHGADFYEEVWLVSGNVVIEYTHQKGARLSPMPPETKALGTSTDDVDLVINVNGAATTLLAANTNRRQVTIQNLSVSKITISKQPNPPAPAAVIATSKVIAILAPCAVAGDGTGGTLVLTGFSGAIYANAPAAALVAVGAY